MGLAALVRAEAELPQSRLEVVGRSPSLHFVDFHAKCEKKSHLVFFWLHVVSEKMPSECIPIIAFSFGSPSDQRTLASSFPRLPCDSLRSRSHTLSAAFPAPLIAT